MSKNFNEEFNLLKNNYEKKEKSVEESTTYEILKQLIAIYGYDSVCDEISVNKDKKESKNQQLSFIINGIKKKVKIEILCSQLFYLDDSNVFSQKNNFNNKEIKNKNKINPKFNLSHNEHKKTTCKFKVMKNKKEINTAI